MTFVEYCDEVKRLIEKKIGGKLKVTIDNRDIVYCYTHKHYPSACAEVQIADAIADAKKHAKTTTN